MATTATRSRASHEAEETAPSERLRALRARLGGDSLSLGELLDALGPGAVGLLLLLLAIAALVPGIAPVFGVALCVVALGLVAGGSVPWLPARLRNYRFAPERLARGIDRALPRLLWIERYMRRRHGYFLRGAWRRVAAVAALIDGALIVLPIPFGNTAPAVAAIVLALGLAARDGLAVATGVVATTVALSIDVAFVFGSYHVAVGLAQTVL